MRMRLRFWKKLRSDQGGVVTVEIALFSSLMMALAVPTFDLVSTIHEGMRLTSAMRAGTHYAYRRPTDSSGIEAALRAASSLTASNLSVSTGTFCTCGGETIECSATSSCASSSAKYVRLRARYDAPLFGNYPRISSESGENHYHDDDDDDGDRRASYRITESSYIRIQ